MEDLIEALQILVKYAPGVRHPTNCCHDMLGVYVDPRRVSEDDLERLEALSFHAGEGCFYSNRFGSC